MCYSYRHSLRLTLLGVPRKWYRPRPHQREDQCSLVLTAWESLHASPARKRHLLKLFKYYERTRTGR